MKKYDKKYDENNPTNRYLLRLSAAHNIYDQVNKMTTEFSREAIKQVTKKLVKKR